MRMLATCIETLLEAELKPVLESSSRSALCLGGSHPKQLKQSDQSARTFSRRWI